MVFSYILAPWTDNNFNILNQAVIKYPGITDESRIKSVYSKSEGDIIGNKGQLFTPSNDEVFIYMKATTDELDFDLLSGVTDYQIFNSDNQPFETYWI